MGLSGEFLLVIKYFVVVCILVCLMLTPAYLAAANEKSKYDNMRARVGSWLFGWSIVGWIFALFVSVKK